MKKVFIVLMALALIFSLAACGQQEAAESGNENSTDASNDSNGDAAIDGDIIIGVPTMITGDGAQMGMHITNGTEMAIAEINAAGGVLGKQLKAVYADLKNGSSEDAVAAAELMYQKGAVVNLPGAFYGSSAIYAFGKYDMPFLFNNAESNTTDAYLEAPEQYSNIFMMICDEKSYGPYAFNIMTTLEGYEYPNQKIAILGGDTNYDINIKAGIADSAKAEGWDIVLNDTYVYGNTEFSAQLTKIRAENPAIIFAVTTSLDTAVAFTKQFDENPTDSLLFVQFVPSSPEYKQLLGEKSNGVFWCTCISALPDKKETFNKEYFDLFGTEAGTYSYIAYDMVYIWKQAVEAVGSYDDYDAINAYIESSAEHPFSNMTCGTYIVQPERHDGASSANAIPMQFFQIQGGSDVLLYLHDQKAGAHWEMPWWLQ